MWNPAAPPPPGTHRKHLEQGWGYPGSWKEEERSLPCGWGPACGPCPPHESMGRLRQELMAVPHPADLASINLTIYTHANQL